MALDPVVLQEITTKFAQLKNILVGGLNNRLLKEGKAADSTLLNGKSKSEILDEIEVLIEDHIDDYDAAAIQLIRNQLTTLNNLLATKAGKNTDDYITATWTVGPLRQRIREIHHSSESPSTIYLDLTEDSGQGMDYTLFSIRLQDHATIRLLNKPGGVDGNPIDRPSIALNYFEYTIFMHVVQDGFNLSFPEFTVLTDNGNPFPTSPPAGRYMFRLCLWRDPLVNTIQYRQLVLVGKLYS